MEKQLQPKLRFPEFDEDWEENRLEKLFSQFKSGNTITSKSIFENGKYPVFGGNGLRGYTDSYTHDGKFFLIGRQGALCGNINRFEGKAFISEHAIVCISNSKNDTDFLSQKLDFLNLNRLSESSAQPGLAVNKLLRLKLIVPQLPEQQKIADYLSTIDAKITLLEEKKTELSRYKKAMMQKLFSQEIRFKDENGNDFPDWEVKRLGEVLIEKNDKSNINNQYEILSSAVNGIYLQKDYFTRDIASKNNIGYKILKINQLVFSPQNIWMGNLNVNTKFKIGLVSPSYKIFDFNKVSIEYFKYFLKTPKMVKEYLISSEQGASVVRRNLNLELFKLIKLLIPSHHEQQKIADFLSTIDESIDKVSEQITQTQSFKKAMLQQLFV